MPVNGKKGAWNLYLLSKRHKKSIPVSMLFRICLDLVNYSARMAPTGQTAAHAPQSIHSSGSIT